MKRKSIVKRIDEWALSSPTTICFKDGQKSYTYSDLKQRSDNLAAYLTETHPDHLPVIVYGGLDFEMIVTFLACSKSGHAYVPIDSSMPAERVQLISDVVDSSAIIAWEEWPLALGQEQLIGREQGLHILKQSRELKGQMTVKGTDCYYIIFTSGTTGIPKGVQISHDNLESYTDWMLQDFGIPSGQVFLSQAPYSFDLSVMAVYPALLTGGQVAPLRKDVIADFKQLFTCLPLLGLNVWVSTPSFVEICLLDPRFNGQEMPSLSHFLFCGEELAGGTVKQLMTRFPASRIFNTYGPTEATVAISQLEITEEILERYQRLPIGRIKDDTAVYIMDEGGQVLADGEVGEIVIVGPSVSPGYYQSLEKTSEAFMTIAGLPAYKTGDAGKISDGLLFYQGRLDFQIKLHGYRIELGDIEHHLSEVSYVAAAVVVPKYQEHKVQQLVAYIVVKDHPFTKAFQLSKAIKEELKTQVMAYMIPQKYVYVDTLPLTANGKLDRKSLINEVNA